MNSQNLLVAVLITLCTVSCVKQPKSLPKDDVVAPSDDTILVDSRYTFDEAIAGTNAPKKIIDQLELIDVKYYSTDGKVHQGQLVVNKKIASDITEIFDFMMQEKFPVHKVIPIVHYDWNDEKSMEDNNTSSFCYRNVSYSFHADGMAVDINPLFNPLCWKDKYSQKRNVPTNGTYNPDIPGTFYEGHKVVALFKELGFRWGRDFSKKADNHHFEKGPYRVRPKPKTDSTLVIADLH